MLSELKYARVNGELWQSDLTNSVDVGVENVTNYLLVCWHLAKMRNTINILCLLYCNVSKQTLCVGLEGQRVFEQQGKKESRHMPAYD